MTTTASATRRLLPRLRLDLTLSDVGFGLASCLRPRAARALRGLEADLGETALVALSVRSAFDAYLASSGWPAGSEILMSAPTIADMPRIVAAHGYIPVPVDIDPDTLTPTPATLAAACTRRTVAWVHAHLFGTVSPLTAQAALLNRRGVAVIEDRAQAFLGGTPGAASGAAATFYSFGTIKTATATGGAVAHVADAEHRSRMRALIGTWPFERRRSRARRIARCGVLILLGRPAVYGRLVRLLERRGHDPDAWVHASTRGFGGPDFFGAIRHRPSAPLIALLARRLRQDTAPRVRARAAVGERIAEACSSHAVALGSGAPIRTHWVLAVTTADPDGLVGKLRDRGFDATRRSSLAEIASPDAGAPRSAAGMLAQIVYVPLPRPSETHPIVDLERTLRALTITTVDDRLPVAA